MDGYTYDCIRFKIPYNYAQTEFNKPEYREFILYSRVNRWEANENDLELDRLPIYDKSHLNWYCRHTIRFWFCSCRSGSRYNKNPIFVSYIWLGSLGASIHVNAALFGFGTSTQGRKQHSVKTSVALGPDDFSDTTKSPESEASKRARHRMNWRDESDDNYNDCNDYFDAVWINVICFLIYRYLDWNSKKE